MAVTRRTGEAAGAEGVALTGRAPARAPVPTPRLKLEPAHNFVFLAHPARWDVAVVGDEPVVIPRLRQFHYEPGLACVEPVKGSFDGDPTRALELAAKKGWQAIPRDRTVVAWEQEWDDYALVYDGHRGPVHLSVWHKPYTLGGQVVVDFDDEGWLRFLANLLKDGVIAGPDRMVRRALELEFKGALNRYRTSAERSATAAGISETYEVKMRAFTVVKGGRPAGGGAADKPPERPAPKSSKPAPAPKLTDDTSGTGDRRKDDDQ